MSMHYSQKTRETDAHALPDVEVWYEDRASVRVDDGGSAQWTEPGWYWWTCFPGCLPDSEPMGPFATEAEALKDAQGGE